MVLESLTSRDAEAVARETRDLIEGRDVVGLAVSGLSAAGGVVVAQTVADIVLDAADLNVDPENLTDYAASIVTKGVVAAGFAFVATSLSGLGLIATGFMALGAIASAGADLLEALLVTAPLGEDNPLVSATTELSSPSRRNARTVSASKRSARRSPSPSASTSSTSKATANGDRF